MQWQRGRKEDHVSEKDQRAPLAQTAFPIEGMCICDHNELAHTKTDHAMRLTFPGQKWNGCGQCGCLFFRQEDEISVGLREGTLRFVVPERGGHE